MDQVTPVVDITDKKRLLSAEEGQDDTNTVLYNRLPVGAWLIERLGVLSSLNPIKRRKV